MFIPQMNEKERKGKRGRDRMNDSLIEENKLKKIKTI